MKTKIINLYSTLIIVVIATFICFSSCSKNEIVAPTEKAPASQMKTVSLNVIYPLSSVNSSGISGTVSFSKASKGTKVTISLTGTKKGMKYAAYIRNGSLSTTISGNAVTLNPVNGSTGVSSTVVSSNNFGLPLTYEDLITYDGNIKVYTSSTQLSSAITQGNIGSNY